MHNVNIINSRPYIKNGWIVKADSFRFGKQAIMFEGNMDECIGYVMRQFENPLVSAIWYTVNGKTYKATRRH